MPGQGPAEAWRVDVRYGQACGSDAERCATYSVDEHEDLLGSFVDADCDGVPDSECVSHVAWQGGRRIEMDRDCSGAPDICSIDVVVPSDALPEVGENCALVAECTTTFSDALGNQLGYEVDQACDGELEACFSYTEEPPGTRSGGHDTGCDGTLDASCVTSTVDANSGITREELDSDCDGEAEVVRCFGADPSNGGEDRDCDGTLDASCYTWTYDADGRTISHGYDADCDGTFDGACTTVDYDEHGNAHAVIDADCDQTTCLQSVNYGSAQSGQATDFGCDGVLDENCEIWVVDDDGRPLRFDSDHDCDGTPSRAPDSLTRCWTSWTYTPL